jgi:predicted nuclease of predicted toxin-antitoxin system
VTLRILLDEDLSQRVAEGLRQRGIDAISVHELAREGLPDEEQLAFAAEQGRLLITYNRADFQALDAEWRSQRRHHAGILWCNERTLPRRNIGALIRAIEASIRQHSSFDDLCLPLS